MRLQPDSGFFVDSLGWVHFKLGNIDLAVAFLEKATLLEPADPVITDHLADAYWQAGRLNEARYKWAMYYLLPKIQNYGKNSNHADPMITGLHPPKSIYFRGFGSKPVTVHHRLDSVIAFTDFGDKLTNNGRRNWRSGPAFHRVGPFARMLAPANTQAISRVITLIILS